jgi:hypothetical protein
MARLTPDSACYYFLTSLPPCSYSPEDPYTTFFSLFCELCASVRLCFCFFSVDSVPLTSVSSCVKSLFPSFQLLALAAPPLLY